MEMGKNDERKRFQEERKPLMKGDYKDRGMLHSHSRTIIIPYFGRARDGRVAFVANETLHPQ